MNDYIWYVVITSTSLYLLLRLTIHLLEFSMFMKIKEILIMELYYVLSDFDDNKDMDLNRILEKLYKKVDATKGEKFVETIQIYYGENENMILSLIMDNGKTKPKFDFNVELGDIINIKEID